MRPLLLLPVVGLAVLTACGSSPDRVTVASKDRPNATTTLPAAEPTTTSPSTTAPPTTVTTAAPGATTTTADPAATTTSRPAPSTTTTTRPATTTTRPAAKTISVAATPGQYYTDVLVKGAGCAGPEYGVTLEIQDPSGQAVDGNGGLAFPDGAWELHVSFGSNRPAGQYSFHAKCIVTNGPTVFAYAPQTMTWAG